MSRESSFSIIKPADVCNLPITSLKFAENETFKITSRKKSDWIQ